MQAAGAFAHEGEAADWLDAALGHLAATDWTSLSTTAHGDMLRRLQRAQAQLTAVNAASTAALTAVSLACARCSRRSMSPCAVGPSDAQSVAAR